MKLEYTTSSNKHNKKEKNGDYLGVFLIEEENTFLFLLSDGVGGSTGDWKASEKSVNLFHDFYRKKSNESDIKQRISKSILDVNKEILLEEGLYKGMKATLIVMVYVIGTMQIYYTSIGDSRIYKIFQNKILQLSEDQIKAVVRRKKDGTLYTQSGSILTAQGVTQVMGVNSIEFDVKSIDIEKTTSFLIATDGFYSKLTESMKEFIGVHNSLNIKGDFDQITNNIKQIQDDDASAIFFRLEKEDDSSTLNEQRDVFNKLLEGINSKNDTKVNDALDYIESNEMNGPFELYDNLIKQMWKIDYNNSDVYQRLISLLKRSRK